MTRTALIYGRVMGLTSTRMLNLENLFQDKLAPIPTSVFSDNGKMCLAMTNVALKSFSVSILLVLVSSKVWRSSMVAQFCGQ